MMFTINNDCIKCGLCHKQCLRYIINIDNNGFPFVAEADKEKCCQCGQCVSFCPVGACFLDFQENRVLIDPLKMPDPESAETLLRSRRSVRSYKDELVSQEIVERILETTCYAPSAINSQPVRWIVSMTRERTSDIAAQVIDFFRSGASEIEGSEMGAFVTQKWDQGQDIIFRGAPQLAVAMVDKSHYFPEDAAFALSYFELAAHSLGVGCCWAGFFTIAIRNDMFLKSFLGVKDDEYVVGAQMFGVSTMGLSRIFPPRKKVNVSWI